MISRTSCSGLVLTTILLFVAGNPALAKPPRRAGKPVEPLAAGAALSRVFLAVDGQQALAPVTGPTTVVVEPGDTVRVMVWVEDTTNQDREFEAYQVVMLLEGTPLDGATGSISYIDRVPGMGGGDSVLVDTDRPDWVFADSPLDFPPTYSEPGEDFGFFAVIYGSFMFPTSLVERGILYLCEFELEASNDASGTFELEYHLSPPFTAMFEPQGSEYQIDEYQALHIVVGAVPVPIASVPPDGAVDARQPSALDGSDPDGWDQVTFIYPGDAPADGPQDFDVQVSGGTTPSVVDVSSMGSEQIVTFDAPIPVDECTTITHLPSGVSTSLGYLPADVDGDGTSGPLDILVLVDGLNGVLDPPLEMWQCDIDRSELCQPADILREIDLLNGAGAFESYNGALLPACP